MKMLAAVYSGIGKIECREVKKPEVNEKEVLVKVKAAAICGTDLRIYKTGHFKIKEGEEIILGHEFAGEILEVGSEVERYKEGMRVGVAPNIGCGMCRYCRMGKTHLCPDYDAFGINLDGGFAEFIKIHNKALQQGNLIAFDVGTTFEEAVLAEPLACCYSAYISVATHPGDSVLIVGAGPMGALHLQLSKLAGASKIMIADIAESRLKLIENFEPDILINTEKEDLLEAVMRNTGGMGADVVITSCAAPEIQNLSVKLTAKLGRINLFGGLPKGRENVELNTNLIHYNGLIVTGTTGASLADYELSINLIVNKKIDTGSIISKRFNLYQIREAFEYAMSGSGLKTIIEV